MDDGNPYVSPATLSDRPDAGALVKAISLLGTVSLVSLAAMLPLGYLLRFQLPRWILLVAVVCFFASIAINGVLVLVLAISTAFRDFADRRRRHKATKVPPWEECRHIDEGLEAAWYGRLSERLQSVEPPAGFVSPDDEQLFQDPHTGQYWLRGHRTQGFGSFGVWIPVTM